MQIFKYSLVGVLGAFIFSGCTGSIVQIDDTEAFSYIKKYEAEYQQIKSNSQNTEMPVKWIQATNKKEPCKLFIGYNPNDDRTLKDGYKIFWDGECKNGYAYGLGREFEKGFLTNLEAIALYSGGEKKPEYFIQKDNLSNITMEGDITNGNYVKTIIKDDGINFDIWYQYGHFQENIVDIGSFINSNPFSDQITYIKAYPNFAYVIGDLSNDEFSQYKYNYNMVDGKRKQLNGFVFSVSKNNIRFASQQNYGQFVRHVDIPQSYLNHIGNVFNEVKNAGQVAIDAQKKALMVKQQYKDIICKDSVKVDFMDNNEYKAICNEDKKLAELKKKMDTKLAQIEQQKQAKRQQQNEQRLIQAREAEANAAMRKAKAAEDTNFNQSIQNFNNNLQMQQLNNNLMMNNLMPKRYDVYVH
ncbi:hypothetical protein [Arcobacter aquimarinus]|uniref:hypothetical protein n=1 Tax=Arcobacter aquimarinus TaxID=1315211 RepID=UPI003BB08A7A